MVNSVVANSLVRVCTLFPKHVIVMPWYGQLILENTVNSIITIVVKVKDASFRLISKVSGPNFL